MAVQIQFRRGLASEWTAANTVLAEGEMGVETDTDQFKIGDGTTAWTSLAYGGLQGTSFTSIFTVKGQIAVATGSGTAAALSVGSAGQALVVDSTTATGVKWASAGADVLQVQVFS